VISLKDKFIGFPIFHVLTAVGLAFALTVSGCGQSGEAVYTIADSTVFSEGNEADGSAAEASDEGSGSDSSGSAAAASGMNSAAASDDSTSAADTESAAASGNSADQALPGPAAAETAAGEDQVRIVVYICGAVNRPGIYSLPDGSRVYQAVEAAGGLTEEADSRYLNQAQRLLDGEQITVYTSEETEALGLGPGSGPLAEDGNLPAGTGSSGNGTGSSGSGSGATAGGSGITASGAAGSGNTGNASKVNLNTADRDTLMTLPGIGEAKADAILSYRETNGGFSSIEDIQNIPGIKEKAFAKIKDLITV